MLNTLLPVKITHNLRLFYYLIRQGSLWKILIIFLKNRLFHDDNRSVSLENCFSMFTKDPIEIKLRDKNQIDIIIPVHNGFEYLEKLFQSIFRNTLVPFRMIIIDDCSSDKRVSPFLERINTENPNATLLVRNKTNKGFVTSVNIGFQYTKNHFVILNTDVEVPPNWLERLMAPIFTEGLIASTTPFSNAADIFGFPKFPQNNPIFEGLDVETLDSFFQYVRVIENGIEIPTGVGFCMGINKNVTDIIGMFDSETFGLGYCEENDWCMRAKKAGYKNILVPNLFVYHKQGASFENEKKKKLLQKNYWRLVQRHKEYLPSVYGFTAMDPLRHIRALLTLIISVNSGTGPKRIELFFDAKTGERRMRYLFKQHKVVFTFDNLTTMKELFSWIPVIKVNFQIMNGFPDKDKIEKIMTLACRT